MFYAKRFLRPFLIFQKTETNLLYFSAYYGVYQILTCNRIILRYCWLESFDSVSLDGGWNSIFLMSSLVMPILLNHNWETRLHRGYITLGAVSPIKKFPNPQNSYTYDKQESIIKITIKNPLLFSHAILSLETPSREL